MARGCTLLAGIVLGLVGTVAKARLLESFLWQTERTDPVAYGVSAEALFAIVVPASWRPARRATSIDPVEALRAG